MSTTERSLTTTVRMFLKVVLFHALILVASHKIRNSYAREIAIFHEIHANEGVTALSGIFC